MAYANLRCGLWYVPSSAARTCYFKSTDGHAGNWSFSLIRLNLHVALQAAAAGGCFVVDATRRGKVFPVCTNGRHASVSSTDTSAPQYEPELLHLQDALSKTIPIWTAVLNRAVAVFRNSAGLPDGPSSQPTADSAASPLLDGDMAWDRQLYMPPWVPAGEATQIEQLVDGWAAELLRVIPSLCSHHLTPSLCLSASQML